MKKVLNVQLKTPVSIDDCSMAKAIATTGDKWKLLILREAFYGFSRFADIEAHVGVSPNILTSRLNQLVSDGLFSKVPYKDKGKRTRYAYELTQKGRDLLTVLVALMQWGDNYLGDPADPPLQLIHRKTKQKVTAALVVSNGERIQSLNEVKAEFWPNRSSLNQVQSVRLYPNK